MGEDVNPYEGVGSEIKTIALFAAIMLFIVIVVSGVADSVGCETEYDYPRDLYDRIEEEVPEPCKVRLNPPGNPPLVIPCPAA